MDTALIVQPKRPAGILVLMALAVILHAFSAWARPPQGNSGAIRLVDGTVSDQTGAPLPRTLVEVRDGEGTLVASVRTNGQGQFGVALKEGSYTVSATLAGFAPLRDRLLEVTPSNPPLSLTLEIPSIEQQVVVTATRTETPVSQVGSNVHVISGEQLAVEGIASVAEALRRIAGLSIVRSGGNGQITSLFMRGGESKYTKILLDGISVNEPGGSYNFANISTANVDRIEVVRGPQSALFGSDAIAGVVQIFTRRGSSEGLSPKPMVLIEGGTFATYRYGGGIEGKSERMDYSALFTRFDTDNDVANGSFNEGTFSGNLGIKPSRKTELRAVFRSESGRTGVPGAWAFQRPDPDAYYRRRDAAGGITFTHHAAIGWTQKISYTVNDSRQFSHNPFDSGSYTPEYEGRRAPFPFSDFVYQTLNQTRRQKVSYQSDWILPHGHMLTAGADYEHESGRIGDPDFDPLTAFRDNYGGFVQDQWALHNRLFVAAGVRMEHNDSFGFFAAPRLSVAVHVHQPSQGRRWGLTKIKGNFGLGIKEPTLVESFSESPYFLGNPDLLPEKSVGFDAGIEQHFGAGDGAIEVVYFDTRFRNQIGFEVTDYLTYAGTFFNIGKTRARGVETVVQANLGARWEVSGSYTFLDSIVLESTSAFDPAFAKGQELFRRPRHSGHLDLRWKPGRWTFGASGVFIGSRVDADFSSLGILRNPGYGTLNLLASFRLSNTLSYFAVVNNALNKKYMEALGYPALRAHFRIGLRAGF